MRLPGTKLLPGAFGGNLPTVGLREGDVQAGTAALLAVQPRRPCLKLGIRLQRPAIVREFEQA